MHRFVPTPLYRTDRPIAWIATFLVMCCVSLSLLGLQGCGTNEAESPGASIADIPKPESWDGVEVLVRRQIEGAYQRLANAGDDARQQGRAWIDIARSYHANDLIDLAAACYEQAEELNAHDATSWYDYARLRAELGDVDSALDTIQNAIDLDAAQSHLAWRRGMWLLELGSLDQAQAAFEKSTELDPTDPVGWIGMARVAAERGEDQLVIDTLETYITNPNAAPNADYLRNLLATAYQHLGDEDMAAALRVDSERRSLSWPDPWSDAMYDMRRKADWIIIQADQRIQVGRPDLALEHLAPLEETHANDPTLLKMKAKAYFTQGAMNKAIEIMEQVVVMDPSDLNAQRNLALAYERIGQPQRAVEPLVRIFALDRTNVAIAIDLGRVLMANGSFEQAILHYQAALRAEPNSPDLFVAYGAALTTVGQFSDARDALGNAARMNPDTPMLDQRVQELEEAVRNAGG